MILMIVSVGGVEIRYPSNKTISKNNNHTNSAQNRLKHNNRSQHNT
eukprot:UN19743